jgi:ubiquinone/menaquinone biosynthesis C-methylase UbiE
MRRLYDRFVVPHLVHWGMQSAQLGKWRAQAVADAHGRVLEIGIGSGLNFPHYGREVREVVGVDPAPALLRRAAKAGGWMPFKIRLLCQSAEHLPYPDQSFDCVVTTWTLCSIPDPLAALVEARRVLRPGGRLLFVDKSLSEKFMGHFMSLAVSRCEELVGRRCCGPSSGPRGPHSPAGCQAHLRSAYDRRRLCRRACPMPRHRAALGFAPAVDRRPMKCPINFSDRL